MANNETETDASRIMFINSADTQLTGGAASLTTDYTATPPPLPETPAAVKLKSNLLFLLS